MVITWAGATGITLFQQIDDLGLKDELAVVRAFNSNDIEAATNQADDRHCWFHHLPLHRP